VLGCGKEGALSLGIGIERGKLVIYRGSHSLQDIALEIVKNSPRVNPFKYFIIITLSRL